MIALSAIAALTVVAVGDSNTIGANASWPNHLVGVEVENVAQLSTTSQDWATGGLYAYVEEARPFDVSIVMLGTNDSLDARPNMAYAVDMLTIARREPDTILLTPPLMIFPRHTPRLREYRESVLSICDAMPSVRCVDIQPLIDPSLHLLPDGVHVNELGQQVIAEAVQKVLLPLPEPHHAPLVSLVSLALLRRRKRAARPRPRSP